MTRLLAALTGVVLLALAAPARRRRSTSRSVDAGDYPRTQATVVTAQADAAAAGVDGERASRPPGSSPTTSAIAKSICLLVDHSQSMKGAAR